MTEDLHFYPEAEPYKSFDVPLSDLLDGTLDPRHVLIEPDAEAVTDAVDLLHLFIRGCEERNLFLGW